MNRTVCALAVFVAVLSFGCQPEVESVSGELEAQDQPALMPGPGLAAQAIVFDTVYDPGTYVYTEETADGVVTETLTVPEGARASLEIDRPGDDNDDVTGGSWEQTYDGIAINFSRGQGMEPERLYFKGLEDGDLTEKEGTGKVYVRVPDAGEPE